MTAHREGVVARDCARTFLRELVEEEPRHASDGRVRVVNAQRQVGDVGLHLDHVIQDLVVTWNGPHGFQIDMSTALSFE